MKKNEKVRKKNIGRGMTDLTGRRFGRLTAEYPTSRRDHKGSVYWHCICDCGKEAEVTEDGLIFGNNRSCGCLKRELQSQVSNQLHKVDGTCVEWLEKRKSRSDNTSGFRGVYHMHNGKYRVTIGFKGDRFYLGMYDKMEDAIKIRLKAERDIHESFVERYREWEKKAAEDPEWGKENPLFFQVRKDKTQFYRVITEETVQKKRS